MPLNKNLQPLSGTCTCRYCGQPAGFQIAFSSDRDNPSRSQKLSSRPRVSPFSIQ